MRAGVLLAGLVAASAAQAQVVPNPPKTYDQAHVERWLEKNITMKDTYFSDWNEEVGVFLLEVPSLKVTKEGFVRAWQRIERFNPTENGIRSARMLYEVDCNDQSHRLLAGDYYEFNNGVQLVESLDAQSAEWSFPRPNTLIESFNRDTCEMMDYLAEEAAKEADPEAAFRETSRSRPPIQ